MFSGIRTIHRRLLVRTIENVHLYRIKYYVEVTNRLNGERSFIADSETAKEKHDPQKLVIDPIAVRLTALRRQSTHAFVRGVVLFGRERFR